MNNNNTNAGGSFRAKRNPFTQVSNSALRDDSLSLKAKGLYSLIQSYITIPNFTLYKGHLMSLCKEKEKAFDSAWKELKDNGYLKQYRIPKGKNDTFIYEYDLLDIADLTTPSLINLNKNGREIKNNNENTEQKDSNSHTPHLVPYAENNAESAYPPFSTLCQTHPMRKGGGIIILILKKILMIIIRSLVICQRQTAPQSHPQALQKERTRQRQLTMTHNTQKFLKRKKSLPKSYLPTKAKD